MNQHKIIQFQEVKTGDKVYHAMYYAADKWREVTKITSTEKVVSLYLGSTAHDTIDTRTQISGHPREGIATRRYTP